jgi:hypothetical protein
MARPSSYTPVILPVVRACATFGATAEEIANYLNIPWGSFKRWIYAKPELREALKRGRDASDERVVTSLYRMAIGYDQQVQRVTKDGTIVTVTEHVAPVPSAAIFWMKNRRPSEWRDVQQIDQAIGHYIISDKPMTEQEWIEARGRTSPGVRLDSARAL